MTSNTPNLNLLKKDPVTDGNDTFNIQTMMNDNWDKIDAAVGQLEEDMNEVNIPLSDETNGTRSSVAGSEKAVGLVMQAASAANLAAATAQNRADQAFQAGDERKAEVVAALVALGVSASTSESWDTLIGKMSVVIRSTGNATEADVLADKTFSNASANGLVGSIPSKVATTITPGRINQTIGAKQYLSGVQTILGDANLIAANIKKDTKVFNVTGEVEELFDVRPALDSLNSLANYSSSCSMYLHPYFYRVECYGNVISIKKISQKMVQIESKTLYTFSTVSNYVSNVFDRSSPKSIGIGYDIGYNSYGQSVVINVNGVVLASSSTHSMRGIGYTFKNGNYVTIDTYGITIHNLTGTVLFQLSYGSGYTSGKLEDIIPYGDVVYVRASYLHAAGETNRYSSVFKITPTTVTKIGDVMASFFLPTVIAGMQNYMN